MDDGTRSGPLLSALTSIRLTTVPLALLTLLFLFIRSPIPVPTSPSPITAVVISTVSPRRPLIITFFLFCAFTYLLDELIVFVYWATRGFRQSYFTQWRGVELADVAGFLAYINIVLIGAWKDRKGIDLWMRKSLKLWVLLAIVLDIAYLVLLVLSVRIFEKRSPSPGVPERPNIPGIYVPNFLHFLALDFRLLILFITLIVLFKPSKTYSTVAHGGGAAGRDHEEATPSSRLLPASVTNPNSAPNAHYGTFVAHDAPKSHANGESLEAAPPLALGGKDGLKAYDASSSTHPHGEGSSSVHSKKDHTIAAGEVTDEPEPLVPRQPDIEDVENPVTDDPNKLTTSYAAVAAKHADKENQDDAPPPAESPSAFAFPSGGAGRDDSSSMRGVTFSDAPRNGDPATEGEEIVGIDGKKRKRISSQNFKRIVRKISEIPKRQGSISSLGSASRATPIPTPGEGLTSSPGGTPKRNRASREDSRMSGEGSIGYAPSGESPVPSIGEDGVKKQRFRKRLSLSLRGRPKETTDGDAEAAA